MKNIILALVCSLFLVPAFADFATDKKIYKDTVIWPILQQIVLCRPGASGLPANATQAQIDKCWADMQGKGFRFPTMQSIKDEVNLSSTIHANLARGTWKIKTAATPAEYPFWDNRCGALTRQDGTPIATTFEECDAWVSTWSNPDSRTAWMSRSYIVDENGNLVDHRNAYTIQPGWAKKLGHTNPRFATSIWNNKLPELKRKLAAAAPKTTP